MLRNKIFRHFVLVIILFAGLSLWFGIRVINKHVINEAQERVRLDLRSAWFVYNAAARERLAVLRLLARQRFVVDACATENWGMAELQQHLHSVRQQSSFDFLTLASAEGNVVLRSAPPYNLGDSCLHLANLDEVFAGKEMSGTILLSGIEVEREAEGLAERAYIEVEDTPKAQLNLKMKESRAMVLITATPVFKGPLLVGVLYGGVVLNRNAELVDSICTSVYGSVRKNGYPLGTATLFLLDTRVATTVRKGNGNRAIGSRVSKEVAEKVVNNGVPWVGRAFVVHDWYLTAYDPIRDPDGNVIGMLYVGTLERPFMEMGRGLIYRYVALTGVTLILAFLSALALANRLARPIYELAQAADDLRAGMAPRSITIRRASKETDKLVAAFNEMTRSLQERERSLREANSFLEIANHDYLELLGFVSHELKSPIAAMTNYVYLLKKEMIGNLNEKQKKAVGIFDRNISRMTEMIRHYLNLSRIEEGLLNPIRTQVNVLNDVLTPLIESSEEEIRQRHMRISNTVSPTHVVYADVNMIREVFENLMSNAIKYSREGGQIAVSAAEEDTLIRFAVRNEGEGIPRERWGGIFEKFSRIEELHTASKQKGTGLGLFITRTIVEAHGGSIEVDSEPGNWAEFRFTIPRYCDSIVDSAATEKTESEVNIGKEDTDSRR